MASGRRKIAVIGAGNVGATCAFVLAQMKVADVVLLDIYEGFAKGKALDMSQNANVLNYDGTITGTADYNDIAGAEVVVVRRVSTATRHDPRRSHWQKCRYCLTGWSRYQGTRTRCCRHRGHQPARLDDLPHAASHRIPTRARHRSSRCP